MAPGSVFHHINLPTLSYFHCRLFYFASLFTLYHKNTKNIILSYLSDLTLVSDREGIDNPFIALVARIYLFVQASRERFFVMRYFPIREKVQLPHQVLLSSHSLLSRETPLERIHSQQRMSCLRICDRRCTQQLLFGYPMKTHFSNLGSSLLICLQRIYNF